MCGEAVVFTKNNMPKHFFTSVKQHGGLLAKGRLLGVQFDALFTDDLYFEIGKSAIACAKKLKDAFRDKGYTFYLDSPTNQIFIVLENQKIDELQKEVVFGRWEKADENHTVVRFVTSWATKEEDVERLMRFDGIVKNRLKIEATITNARLFLAVREEFGSFYDYTLSFFPDGRPITNSFRSLSEIPASSPQSDAMSRDMKKRGFKFFGTTICYAHLQAAGVIDDHLADCICRKGK